MSCSGNMTMTTNSTCATVRLDTVLSSTATSTDSNSYTYYTTTTGNYYGYAVPTGMLPGSGNPDVPSRKYIHDRMVSQTYPDGIYEVCYIDAARKVRYKRLFSPREQNTHWITELIERCIDEIQDIYRAKARGEDKEMPVRINNVFTNNELREMFGFDPYKPVEGSVYPTPKPVKVETYNDRVVKVTFEDRSFTKSVCSDNDTFDLDVGITICILKRAMGKDGHKLYNNMMRDIHKIMDKNEKDKDKAERKTKQRKTELKAAAKKAKARQDQIDIQKTAFVEALRASGIGSGDDLK